MRYEYLVPEINPFTKEVEWKERYLIIRLKE